MEKLFILTILFFICPTITSQQELSILFWNVENLFYPGDDSIKDDDEFTSEGAKYWTFNRYKTKCNFLWKTIYLSGEEDPPDIIGLCEIENRKVLDELFIYSPLRKYKYQIIHQDSPDPRGIDVALVFRADKIKSIDTSFIKFEVRELNGRMTRDILRSTLVFSGDTLEIFVNHWPSKYGGSGYTDILRMKAAELLKREVKKSNSKNRNRYIICCGDFNDNSESRSLQLLTEPGEKKKDILKSLEYSGSFNYGTIKYQGNWELIDHFFVGGSFLDSIPNSGIEISSAQILAHDFLLTEDEKYGGMQPFRSYLGYRYIGGISDHLPVLLRLYRKVE